MFITENSAQKASFLLFSSFAFKMAHNLRVGGSSPSGSTKNFQPLIRAAFFLPDEVYLTLLSGGS